MRVCTIRPQHFKVKKLYRLSELLDKTLDILKSGKHYTKEELSKRLRITDREANLILSFLSKFNFIESVEENKLRINPTIKELWGKL